jgi:hypothetical protein
MMLDFIQELNEARLYRGTDTLKGKTADDLSKVAFLMIMMLEILRHEDKSYASTYVHDTISYENFESMRSSASDLHNLLAVLNHQEKYEEKIKTNLSISVPVLQIKRYLRDIENHRFDHGQDRSFFLKLEDFLKISDSKVKSIRRVVGDWKDNSHGEKDIIRHQIKNLIQASGQQSDILQKFKTLL